MSTTFQPNLSTLAGTPHPFAKPHSDRERDHLWSFEASQAVFGSSSLDTMARKHGIKCLASTKAWQQLDNNNSKLGEISLGIPRTRKSATFATCGSDTPKPENWDFCACKRPASHITLFSSSHIAFDAAEIWLHKQHYLWFCETSPFLRLWWDCSIHARWLQLLVLAYPQIGYPTHPSKIWLP